MSQQLQLLDKSAFEQRRHSEEVREHLRVLAAEGALATCQVVALEVCYSARNLTHYERLERTMKALPWLDVTVQAMNRALDTQHRLAKRGHHRVPLPDLIIAATAEVHGAGIVHYDHDFDIIAAVTDQPSRWIVPRGTAG